MGGVAPQMTDEFPAQMASNAENVSISCRHQVYFNRVFVHMFLKLH